MKIAAQIISWIFIPLLMPIYALMVAMYIPSVESSFYQENTLFWMHPTYKLLILGMFFIFSFLAPGVSLYMLKKNNAISNIEVDNRRERGVPIIISAVYCLLLGVLLWVKAPDRVVPSAVYALPWGGFLGIALAGIINRYEKISLHGTGAGMLFGFFTAYYHFQAEYYFEILVVAILVCGLVLSSRVYLGKHTLRQVLMGFGLGFICVFSVVFMAHFWN